MRLLVVPALLLLLPSSALAQDGGAADAGVSDAGTLTRLAADYQCPDAPPPEPLDGGAFYPSARVLRLNCLLAGAGAEVMRWRDFSDGGAIAPVVQSNTAHVVISTVSAVLGAWTIYAQSRDRRHLPLWPP